VDARQALDQIAEIHGHLAKGELYRGWRAAPVALSGLVGLTAAWLQRPALGASDPVAFVIYWTAVAAAAAAVGASEILYNYVATDAASSRRQTRRVFAQFLPALAAGALATATIVRLGAALVALLPGLWALFFGIAVFASRPYLPRASGLVALFYCLCGAFLLSTAHTPIPLSPWAVGGVFGAGQLIAAVVIYWNLERQHG
jgi:hypothetical protein